MKQALTFLIVAAVLVALLSVSGALYVVMETQQVVVTQFGKAVGAPITTPGIKFKMPYIQKANYFDKRFLEWDGDANQVPTKDKKFIWVDTYARWKIVAPLLFFQRLRDVNGAQSRLDDILDGATRSAIARHDLVEIVRSTTKQEKMKALTEEMDILRAQIEKAEGAGEEALEEQKSRLAELSAEMAKQEGKLVHGGEETDGGEGPRGGDDIEGVEAEITQAIDFGRKEITREIIDSVKDDIQETLGIELLDLRFKRINYVENVRKKVYDRMKSERERIAEKYRSEGQGESAHIRGDMEKALKEITSEAYRKAQKITGEADAEATRIYADAYNEDPEFYRFIKTLETYDETIDKESWLILSTGGEFFQYLKGVGK